MQHAVNVVSFLDNVLMHKYTHNIQAMQKLHNVHLIMVAFIEQAQKNI